MHLKIKTKKKIACTIRGRRRLWHLCTAPYRNNCFFFPSEFRYLWPDSSQIFRRFIRAFMRTSFEQIELLIGQHQNCPRTLWFVRLHAVTKCFSKRKRQNGELNEHFDRTSMCVCVCISICTANCLYWCSVGLSLKIRSTHRFLLVAEFEEFFVFRWISCRRHRRWRRRPTPLSIW